MSNLLEKASIVTTPTAYDNGKILSVKPSVVLGEELITNGDFATNSDWVLTQATISNGKVTISTPDGSYAAVRQFNALVIGKTYLFTIDVDSISSGSIVVGNSNLNINSLGIYSGYYVSSSTTAEIKRNTFGSATNAVINSISVKQVIDGDFDFTRNSSATRVNSEGLIEDITSNLPRIDYTGGEGHWLFEPQSTNLIPYSEDFTQWNKSNASLINTITSTVVSPDGVSYANKLYPIGSATSSFIIQGVSGNSFSVFVKKGERRWVLVYGGFSNSNVWFDSENGVFGNVLSEATATVESFGNDWYRIKILWTQNSSHIRIYNTDSGTSTQSTGNGTDGLYIWGAQSEVQSFSTSYIPTNGSTVTRLQDAANGAGSSDLINSTEGVLYVEIAALANQLTHRRISISDGTLSNLVYISFDTASNRILANANGKIMIYTVSDETEFQKIAVYYNTTAPKLFVNGVLRETETAMNAITGLSELAFDNGVGSGNFFGKTKCVAVFKEALTDAELTCLTTI